jgi:hypothetical protein
MILAIFLHQEHPMIPITMKTILDKNTQEKLIVRIAGIDQTHQAHWGKMNIYQMLLHNTY